MYLFTLWDAIVEGVQSWNEPSVLMEDIPHAVANGAQFNMSY